MREGGGSRVQLGNRDGEDQGLSFLIGSAGDEMTGGVDAGEGGVKS